MTDAVSPALQATFEQERAAARAREPGDPAAARTETVRMYGRLAELQAGIIASQPVKTECERGCSYCCHLRVEIRPHEAFVLAHHIQTRFSAADRKLVLARLEDNLKRIAPLSAAQHIRAGIACALLHDGVCSVYAGRPATCRKYYSVSVDTCRAAYQDTAAPLRGPIEDDNLRLAGNAVALGFAKGMEEAGYDTSLHELHDALYRALTNPKAEKRYRDGKKAFV